MDENKVITAHFEREQFDLTINVVGEGSTDPGQGTYTYEYEDEINVTACSAYGWLFQGWTGDYEGTEEEIMITMDEDKALTATFEREEFDLTIAIQGEGSTDPSEDTHTYEYGDEVTLTASSAEGWRFTMWTGDHGSIEEEINLTMDRDMEITAHFEEITYELMVDTEGEGTVEVDPDQDEYLDGTNVTLTAIPEEGWKLAEWTGYEKEEEEITITLDEDKEITAYFVKEAYFEVELMGYTQEVTEGDEVTVEYKVTNNGDLEGTQVINFTVDGEVVDSEEITLEGGEEGKYEFTWSKDEPGEYELRIPSEDESREVSVEVVEEDGEKGIIEGTPIYLWIIIIILAILVVILGALLAMQGKEPAQARSRERPPGPREETAGEEEIGEEDMFDEEEIEEEEMFGEEKVKEEEEMFGEEEVGEEEVGEEEVGEEEVGEEEVGEEEMFDEEEVGEEEL